MICIFSNNIANNSTPKRHMSMFLVGVLSAYLEHIPLLNFVFFFFRIVF